MGIIDYIRENYDPKQAKDNLTEDEFDKYLKEAFKCGNKPKKIYPSEYVRKKFPWLVQRFVDESEIKE